MACINCSQDPEYNTTDVRAVCRVCELLDNDTTIKRVHFCIPCGVYICMEDKKDLVRRGEAIAKHAVLKVKAVAVAAVDTVKEAVASVRSSRRRRNIESDNKEA